MVPVLRWHLEREGVQAADEAQLEQIVLALARARQDGAGNGAEQCVLFQGAREL